MTDTAPPVPNPKMTSKRVPILNVSAVPDLGADGHFYLYGNGEIVSLVPAWDGITVDDIYAFVDEQPEGKAVDAVYVPFLHEQSTSVSTDTCWVDAETDDEALLDVWGSSTPEPRINGVDEGHEYFCVYDEKDDGKPEMTKQFKLLFKVPELEVLSFTASLTEAGFSQVVSRPMKKPNPT